MNVRFVLGLVSAVVVVAAAVMTYRPDGGDAGYIEIKTVPVAPVTLTALYLDSTKLSPIKKGSTILRQPVGLLKLQAEMFAGSLAPLCNVVVKRNRITTVTISVLERPLRCQCRYSGGDAATRACVS